MVRQTGTLGASTAGTCICMQDEACCSTSLPVHTADPHVLRIGQRSKNVTNPCGFHAWKWAAVDVDTASASSFEHASEMNEGHDCCNNQSSPHTPQGWVHLHQRHQEPEQRIQLPWPGKSCNLLAQSDHTRHFTDVCAPALVPQPVHLNAYVLTQVHAQHVCTCKHAWLHAVFGTRHLHTLGTRSPVPVTLWCGAR